MKSLLFALSLGFALSPSVAQSETLLIDTARSHAAFELRALWIKRIGGDFARVEGVIERDRGRGRFGVDVRIEAASVRMEKPAHAEWARGADFFAAQQHPWIQFRAEDLPERLLQEGGEIRGLLSLRGTRRRVAFPVAPATCPRAGLDCPVSAVGAVERSAFGMDARRLVLGDRVQLSFSIRAHEGGARLHDRDAPSP